MFQGYHLTEEILRLVYRNWLSQLDEMEIPNDTRKVFRLNLNTPEIDT